MAEQYIKIQNTTDNEKPVWTTSDGVVEEHRIAPHATKEFPADVAEQFLSTFPGLVVRYITQAYEYAPGEESVYVANLTGNPFAPEEVEVEEGGRLVKVPNPIRVPRTITQEMHRSEKAIIDSGDPNVLRYPPMRIVLPPYERVAVPASIAQWLSARAAMQHLAGGSSISKVRAPSSFEASLVMDYADLRVYAMLLDSEFFTATRMKDVFPNPDTFTNREGLSVKAQTAQAKDKLWPYVFHRLIDFNYNPPPREAFIQKRSAIAKKETKI
jgi:hypothetical protein